MDTLTEGCQCCFDSQRNVEDSDPFIACLAPVLPSVDFCADPGNATSNPDASTYECRHPCQSGLSWEEENAMGCHGDNSGNRHEDHLCVVEGVYAPGEEFPWGDVCCSWCEDIDGDGSPDYEGCCEGMRGDGAMGCEDMRCEWMCNGVSCFEHGEDQAMCELNGGLWTEDDRCAEEILSQGILVHRIAEDTALSIPDASNFAAGVWLGRYGDACCTGYEPPSYEGSCDGDIDTYVRASNACLFLLERVCPVACSPFLTCGTVSVPCTRVCDGRT